jgi:hypothetical protein
MILALPYEEQVAECQMSNLKVQIKSQKDKF